MQAQNLWVTENSVIHIVRSEKSVINIDWDAPSTWITEFSVPNMFRGPVSRLALQVLLNHFENVASYNIQPGFAKQQYNERHTKCLILQISQTL
jgi:hypothetical protein